MYLLLSRKGCPKSFRRNSFANRTYRGVDLVRSVLSFKHYARKRVLRGRDSERSREAQNAMINELRQLKRLSHIHLVKIITSYTDNEYIAYLMEPIADCTLETLLATNSPPTPDYKAMVRTFYGCLAGALNYLHKNKVRHRDITARNILIKRGQVYLADFGSAYNSSHCVGSATRHLHTPVSMDYMAPEVAKREERDSKSDMFSLGVIFLEM
ncbi:kinase-like domain-containing protein, partial [Coniella lustricola]